VQLLMFYIASPSTGCSTSAVHLCNWLGCVVSGVWPTLLANQVIWTIKFPRHYSEDIFAQKSSQQFPPFYYIDKLFLTFEVKGTLMTYLATSPVIYTNYCWHNVHSHLSAFTQKY